MGSYTAPRYSKSLSAAVDLSEKQFHYVGDNGFSKANIAGGATGAVGFGFLMNNPKINEPCVIASTGGGAKGVASEIISVSSAPLKADVNGKMANALPGDIVSAISMETAVVGDIFEVLPLFYVKSAEPIVFAAASDLTSGQYLYVGDSSGDIDVVGGAAGAIGYGFLMNAPDAGENAIINGPGYPFAKSISGASFSIGVELFSNASGKMKAAVTPGDIVVAISLAAATGADETIDVIPVFYRKHA